jgi:hypothetical protein
MVGILDPVRGLRDIFRNIYAAHLKEHDSARNINRIWTGVFGICMYKLQVHLVRAC